MMTKDSNDYFRVTGKITKLLGRDALSNDLEAVNEILRNSNDADAESATISFDFTNSPEIKIVEKNGDGMTYDEIVDKFLVIGTYEKTPKKAKKGGKEIPTVTKRLGRVMIGKKGVGRFALEKLGHSVEIISKPINKRQKFSFEIDWDRFESRDVTVDQIPIQVYEEERGKDEESGLEITIKRLRSEWDIDKIEELKEALKKILLPKQIRPKNGFKIFLSAPQMGIDTEELIPMLEDVAFWELHAKLTSTKISIEASICGKPMEKISKDYSEITIHSTGGREKKKVSELVCGNTKLDVYYFPRFPEKERYEGLHKHYRDRAKKQYGGKIDDIRNSLKGDHGVKIYQDGVRQYKYGEEGYDIADRARVARALAGTTKAEDLIGYCRISGQTNPDIEPTINRMEALDNQAFRDLKEFMLFSMNKLDNYVNSERDRLVQLYKQSDEAGHTKIKSAVKKFSGTPVQKAINKLVKETGGKVDLRDTLDTLKEADRIVKEKIEVDKIEDALSLQQTVEASLGEWVNRMYHDFVGDVSGTTQDVIDELTSEKLRKKINDKLFQDNSKKLEENWEIIDYYFDAIQDFIGKASSNAFWKSAKPENVSLKKFVEEQFLRSRKTMGISEDSIKLELHFNEHLSFTVFKPMLYSIFYNLFSNSFKALRPDFEKGVKNISIRVTGLTNKDRFHIHFSDDSSHGLTSNDNDILFDKRVSKGTLKEIGQGLGLYNLREMLYHFDGEIQIEEPYFGKGTTFRISLPVENITRS